MSEHFHFREPSRRNWILWGIVFYVFSQIAWAVVAYWVSVLLNYDLHPFDTADPTRDSGVVIWPHLLVYLGPPLVLTALFFARGWMSTWHAIYRPGPASTDATGPQCKLCSGRGKPGMTYTHISWDSGIYLCDQCLRSEVRDRRMLAAAGLMFLAVLAFVIGAGMSIPPTRGVTYHPIDDAVWWHYIVGGVFCLAAAIALVAHFWMLFRRVSESDVRKRGSQHVEATVARKQLKEQGVHPPF